MELWDAYREDGSLAGCDLVRGEPIPNGLCHLVCEVLVRHTDGSYLLMQRDFNKESHPGVYEATAGGSVLKGETAVEGAIRELKEETGITATADNLTQMYCELNENRNTIYHRFLCVTDCDKSSVSLQEGETINYMWLSEDEFLRFINTDNYITDNKNRLVSYLNLKIPTITYNSCSIERWGMFEVSVRGKIEGNPFTDYTIHGVFRHKHKNETVETDGFYDGGGVYKVRFMPSFEGEYTFEVSGTFSDLGMTPLTGTFTVTPAGERNHGPVRVASKYHFAYEDGTPYYPIGTTCYVWTHQSKEQCYKTLETLKNNVFNKIRFCILPKHYVYNFGDPKTYPYEGTPCDSSVLTEENFNDSSVWKGNSWDFTQFNPAHFQRFESYIAELMKMGIEADVIVMHPYDRWGFRNMGREADNLYWNYVVSRFSAYRNVWWSLANEYDLMPEKTIDDWERYAEIICNKDPYNHLRSIHNCATPYDHSKPWVTHVSYQICRFGDVEYTNELREKYSKPVVVDEMRYEGEIPHGWGNLDGQEMTRRFWEVMCRGGYPGHSETLIQTNGKLWWSHGGELLGESPQRIKFFAEIISEMPSYDIRLADNESVKCGYVMTKSEETHNNNNNPEYFIVYFGNNQSSFHDFTFDSDTCYQAEIIDTWDMTVTDAGIYKGNIRISLPGKPYMAIRFKKILMD